MGYIVSKTFLCLRLTAFVSRNNKSSVSAAYSNRVNDTDSRAVVWLVVRANWKARFFVHKILRGRENSFCNVSLHNAIYCNVIWSLNGESNSLCLNEVTVLDQDIAWHLGKETPAPSLVNDWVIYDVIICVCSFEPDGGLIGVLLRAIVNFNVIEEKLTRDNVPSVINGVGSNNLTAPSTGIVTNNSNVSRQQKNFTSHVNTIVSGSCWLVVTPMVMSQRFCESNGTRLYVVT